MAQFASAGLFDTGPCNAPPVAMAPRDLGGGFAAVPEPAAWLLAVPGAACASSWRRPGRPHRVA